MPLKDDLLKRGYFPENLPPAFTSEHIADQLLANHARGHLITQRSVLRAATYNASKRGFTRRIFSVIHPVTAHNIATFVDTNWSDISLFFSQTNTSYSVPEFDPTGKRALVIKSHTALQQAKYDLLSPYRFIACTDIARYYHSIYTHALPWAFHGKDRAKVDRGRASNRVFFNRADAIVRDGQDGQTIGIPVGPDASRVLAEVIGTAIDLEFTKRIGVVNCAVIRHVDDVWIGADTHADAETALTRYREAIRQFELDINENKTDIYAEDFGFSDSWPSDVAARIEFATNSRGTRAKQHLRSSLEYSFGLAVQRNDDGVLRYILRYLDHKRLSEDHWDVIEPFLKRLAVHFGHTIDYVVRILLWRHLAHRDLDVESWRSIMENVLDKHGRLGNDSEVCWTIYAQNFLSIKIGMLTAKNIVDNCGALSLVALLHSARGGLVPVSIFSYAYSRLSNETDSGPFWPLFLEWKTKRWPRYTRLPVANSTIQALHTGGAYIYDSQILPVVFQTVTEDNFPDVPTAIEEGSSVYGTANGEDDGNDSEEDEDDVVF